MNDFDQPFRKKARSKLDADRRPDHNDCDTLRRKQVDAHVQAFLKAVLDRARGSNSFNASSEQALKKGQRVCTSRDVATQTDDQPDPNEQFLDVLSVVQSCDVHEYGNGLAGPRDLTEAGEAADVPNRSMYSQETLRLVSQNEELYNKARVELHSDLPECAQYYTGLNIKVPDVVPEGYSSSVNFRRAITQWMESYEQWFYQNFGVDVKSTFIAQANSHLPPISSNTIPLQHSFIPQSTAPVQSSSGMQTTTVVSGAPVSYLVPEGSLYMPENQQFSPYVSLLPSFYTSAAFNNQPTQQCVPTTQANLSLIHPNDLTGLVPYHVPTITTFQTPMSFTPTLGTTRQISAPSQSDGSCSRLTGFPETHSCTASYQVEAASDGANLSDFSVEMQTSAMLAALSVPVSNGRQLTMGQWGPLLRYGTYGRLPSVIELRRLRGRRPSSSGSSTDPIAASPGDIPLSPSHSKKMPPPPPTFILLRRQAMVCALQLSCRDRARELFYREKENTSGLKLDFVSELEQVSEKSIKVKPVYLFTRIRLLPTSERAHYVTQDSTSPAVRHQGRRVRGFQGVFTKSEPFYSVDDMYLCDLLIGDVLIAEACSTFKVQAQLSAARQAFRILSQPCFLVGSVRRWDEIDYLVLCLSPRAELVPTLPPFLSDPFESLSKKDRTIQPEENFEVINPKPADEFWIFLANYPITALDNEAHWDRILAQSAEFSQMTISFEVEVDTENGQFICYALVDNERFPPVYASSINKAQHDATYELLENLRKTQPIVGLQSNCIKDTDSLMGVPDGVLVETLMWGKEERELAVAIEQLEAHCDVPIPSVADAGSGPNGSATVPVFNPKDRFRSVRRLDAFLQAYATSSLVTPLRLSRTVVPPNLWPEVRTMSSNWGLLCQVDFPPNTREAAALFVCKRAPLPRLKRTLYDQGNYGCLRLIDRGNLSAAAMKRLFLADPLTTSSVNGTSSPSSPEPQTPPVRNFSPSNISLFHEDDPYLDEPVTQLARHFIATAPRSKIKPEPETNDVQLQPVEDCILVGAELNQPSTAIEILDDLPRTLIPGIDF